MRYEGAIYRPPSEADSLLIQATIGCSWNRCTFCTMYKDKQFRIRSMEDIKKDLLEGSRYPQRFRRIFLCDGDAMVLPTDKLMEILQAIRELFPELEGVRAYALARDVLRKSETELKQLREMGLDLLYIGLETGSDELLEELDKGETRQDIIAAAALLRQAGIQQSITVIAGLGTEENWQQHIIETAETLNAMQPQYLGLLTLTVGTDSPFCVPAYLDVLREMRLLVENLELESCLFSSAHASNYIHVRGHLPQDKQKLLATIDQLIARELADPIA